MSFFATGNRLFITVACICESCEFLYINFVPILNSCLVIFNYLRFFRYPVIVSANLFHLFQFSYLFSSVQSLSHVQLFATPWISAHQASLSITNSRSSPKLTSIESVMPYSHLILCRPLLLLPPIPLIMLSSTNCTLLLSTVLASTSRVKS